MPKHSRVMAGGGGGGGQVRLGGSGIILKGQL